MKYLKLLGLAASVAMALTAFLGAGSASATVLCKTQVTSNCGSGWEWLNLNIEASLSESSVLETTSGTVLDTCNAGTLKSTSTNGSSVFTVTGSVTELTWVECTKTTDTISNGSLELHWISGTDNGTLIGKNNQVTVNTIFGSCTYGTAASGTDLGQFTSGFPSTLDIKAVVLKIAGSALCPEDARWTGTYLLTTPFEGLYVSTS